MAGGVVAAEYVADPSGPVGLAPGAISLNQGFASMTGVPSTASRSSTWRSRPSTSTRRQREMPSQLRRRCDGAGRRGSRARRSARAARTWPRRRATTRLPQLLRSRSVTGRGPSAHPLLGGSPTDGHGPLQLHRGRVQTGAFDHGRLPRRADCEILCGAHPASEPMREATSMSKLAVSRVPKAWGNATLSCQDHWL